MGDDVLAIDQERWQAMARSPSPHWRDDALAGAQLRSMARHWGRNLTRLAPVAPRGCQAVALNRWGAIATPTAVCSHCFAK